MRFEHWLYQIPLRLRTLFDRSRVERELDEEMRFHLEQRIAHEVAGGKTPEEARQAALRAMDGLEQQKERCRDMRTMNFLDDLLRNILYALRALRRSPGFTAVTVVTLALGIGANSAIFSLVDTVMLKLLPVKAPEQLYFLARGPEHFMTWNYPDYRAMRDHNTVFSGLAGYSLGLQSFGVQSGGSGAPELAPGLLVSGNYFDVLGVAPFVGRVFHAEDDRAPGAAPYVVLNYSYWRAHFDGDRQAIGRKIRVNGYPLTVVGVTPQGFSGEDVAYKPDLYVPIMMQSEVRHVPFERWNTRHTWWMAALGRLKAEASIKQAEGELFAICKSQEIAEGRSLKDPQLANKADPVLLEPAAHGYSFLADELKKPLLILFVIVAVVLLIACANVANLMLARGAARQREIAVRLAVGASRWRVIAQLLTESLVIALLGGVAGVLVSGLLVRLLLRFVPQAGSEFVSGINATVDWRVIAFTATACILTGLLFGVVPAWQSTRPDLVPALKEDTPGGQAGHRFTLRKALVVLQVGLSVPLLAGAGLFVRTLGNLCGLDAGFRDENVLIASVDPTGFGYKAQRTRDFYDRLCARVAALPGVRSASLARITPLSGSSWNDEVIAEGGKPGAATEVWFNAVGPRYFETVGTPVLSGREFTERDNPATAIEMPDRVVPGQKLPDAAGRHVTIVNEAFARRYWGGRSALGRHVSMSRAFSGSAPYEIVGVVKDARYFNLRSAGEPMMFLPVWRPFAEARDLVIRTNVPTAQLNASVRREIHALDPAIPLLNMRTLEHDVDENILVERLVAALSALFGLLALLLSAVGLYGVVAFTVTRRTREIGIRIAIGADGRSVLWLVFREVMGMVAAGAAIGLLGAFAASRAIAGILYGVSPNDPSNMVMASVVLVGTAIAASMLPARRAARIDPMTALRYE